MILLCLTYMYLIICICVLCVVEKKSPSVPDSVKLLIFVSTNELTYPHTDRAITLPLAAQRAHGITIVSTQSRSSIETLPKVVSWSSPLPHKGQGSGQCIN